MGTCSYVLVGTEEGMEWAFGSTCHGAGRRLSRSEAMREVRSKDVLKDVELREIELRIADPKLAAEEADEAHKDVHDVVPTREQAGLSRPVARMVPFILIKG